MAKRKVRYNAEFLPKFIERITSSGKGTKANIVSAMNGDREDGRETTVKQLSRWADTGKPIKTESMISLVNHFDDVALSDFFIYEDTNESADIQPQEPKTRRQTRRGSLQTEQAEQTDGIDELRARLAAATHELLQTQLEHEKELNALRAKYEEREDRIREGYDHTIQTLAERIPPAQSTVVVKDQKGILTGLAVNDDNSAEAKREKL